MVDLRRSALATIAVAAFASATAAPLSAAVPTPDVGSASACLAEVVVQTTQLERVQAALVDVFRWRVVARVRVHGRREVLLGSAAAECGRLRLRAIDAQGAEPIRPGAHWWDRGGAYAVNVFVRDAAATMSRFRAHGWVTAQPLASYEEKRNGVVIASGRFGRVIGPDDLVIGFQQRIAPPLQRWPEFEAGSHVENVMEIVGHPEAWLAVASAIVEPDAEFVRLDAPIVSRTTAGSPLGALPFGLPRQFGPQMDARQAILRLGVRGEQMLTAWSFTSIRGEDFGSRIDGAHAGIVALRVRVPDRPRVERALGERGVQVVRRRIKLPGTRGTTESSAVTSIGGSGLSLEVFEARAPTRR